MTKEMVFRVRLKDDEVDTKRFVEAVEQIDGVESLVTYKEDADDPYEVLVEVGETLWRLCDKSDPNCPLADLLEYVQKEVDVDLCRGPKMGVEMVRSELLPHVGVWVVDKTAAGAVVSVNSRLGFVAKVVEMG